MRHYCDKCHYPATTCVCDAIKQIHSPVQLIILQHAKETAHAKNTARLVKLCIPDTQIIQASGELQSDVATLNRIITDKRCALIYPSEDSQPIEEKTSWKNLSTAPEVLLFIDASWKQAHGMYKSIPTLQTLPAIHFQCAPSSEYEIRHTSLSYSLSTLEAVKYCLEKGWGISAAALTDAQAKLISHWQGPLHHRRVKTERS